MTELFAHQKAFLDEVENLGSPMRACLYFKTGSGKSLTALLGMKKLGYTEALVIAPPSTHKTWQALGKTHDMDLTTMSHAKFRMPRTKLKRTVPVIADEFHMFGGQTGQGWRKLDRMAAGLEAPLLLLSATPNYNDVERVYCVQHVLDPASCRGGYLQFLYKHCLTEQDPFSQTPKVVGLHNYPDAAAFLADLPKVFYLEDDLVYSIEDVEYTVKLPEELFDYRYDRRNHRMVASDIEMRHTIRYQGLVDENGRIYRHVMDDLRDRMVEAATSILVYCNHATIAVALSRSMDKEMIMHDLVTGTTTKSVKQERIDRFLAHGGVLIGTATLATGTDGMDKVCDMLIILDDTDDDALRRQLIGRIMPRGGTTSSVKKVLRYVPS